MFVQGDSHAELVIARLYDFFYRRSPWQRRLWRAGLVLSLREVLEYSRIVAEEGLPDEGLLYVASSVEQELDRDLGVRTPVADLVKRYLAQTMVKEAEARDQLLVLSERVQSSYLAAWRAAVDVEENRRPSAELVARAVASHLLDLELSSDHLHRWLRALEKGDDLVSLAHLIESAEGISRRPERGFSVLVPFAQLPPQTPREASGFERLDGRETTNWLRESALDSSGVRYTSSLVFEVQARDPWSAVEKASEIVARLQARATVGHPGESAVTPSGVAYLAGKQDRFPLRQPRRQVEVHSVTRQDALYDVAPYGSTGAIDDALELAAMMESGPAGAALTGGWAAIEALLARPEKRGSAPKAADRFAALVACSYPRAELTTLSYQHKPEIADNLSDALERATTNAQRCRAVNEALARGAHLAVASASDRAAEARLVALLADPKAVLSRIRRYVSETLRRLYNQRNLVMHAGSLRSVALDVTLRTAPALVGAGLDRIVHAALESGGMVTPLQLAARAESEIDLFGTDAGGSLADLLERRL